MLCYPDYFAIHRWRSLTSFLQTAHGIRLSQSHAKKNRKSKRIKHLNKEKLTKRPFRGCKALLGKVDETDGNPCHITSERYQLKQSERTLHSRLRKSLLNRASYGQMLKTRPQEQYTQHNFTSIQEANRKRKPKGYCSQKNNNYNLSHGLIVVLCNCFHL